MLNVKKLIKKILGCCYVTGSSGDWAWKKYTDGTFELWGYVTKTQPLSAASAGTYYNANENKRVDLPIDFYIKSCRVVAIASPPLSSGVYVYEIGWSAQYARAIDVGFRAHASVSNAACSAEVFVTGTWE